MNDDIQQVILSQGTVRYRDVGKGPVIVFVHGLLVSGTVWRKVVPRLSKSHRCIVPDWPLGAHSVGLNADADLTPAGVAALIAEFMAALDLREVTLVGNDSGGALCQLVVAHHGKRVSRLVLTTCDAFEIFPPPLFNYLKWAVNVPGLMPLLGFAMLAIPALTRLALAYGVVSKRPIDRAVIKSWLRASASDAGVRRDVKKFIRGVSPEVTQAVAKLLPQVRQPALIVWTPDDRHFPLSLGQRLAKTLPNARLELVPDSFVFVAEDQPDALSALIERFTVDTRAHAA